MEATKPKEKLDREFTELYQAHLRDVYSYAYYRIGNHHDAEDLTTQTFIQAYRHFERAQRESKGRPLRPWLIRIAHNLAANHYRDRSRKPQTPIDDTTVLSAIHTTEDLVEGRDELKRILDGVQQLPGDRREALIMRFALGMDNREIARALGSSDGATKVLLHRAVKQLEGIVRVEEERMSETTDFETPAAPRAGAGRPARRPLRARRGAPDPHHRAGRGRARGVGGRDAARPAQLGQGRAARRRGRRRRGRRHRSRPAAGAPPRRPALGEPAAHPGRRRAPAAAALSGRD